jgi:hypothetical protein
MSRNVSVIFFLIFILLFSRRYWNKWIDSRRKFIATRVYSSFLRIIFIEQAKKRFRFCRFHFFLCVFKTFMTWFRSFFYYIYIFHTFTIWFRFFHYIYIEAFDMLTSNLLFYSYLDSARLRFEFEVEIMTCDFVNSLHFN